MTTHSQSPNLQQLLQVFTEIPFNQMLGLQLDHFDQESVVMSFEMKNDLIGNFLHGILHGGVISSVLDMAGGMSAMAAAIHATPAASMEELAEIIGNCSTIDLQVSFLRRGHGKRFTAKSTLIKSGKKISFARMDLFNEDDTLIASASGTYAMK